LKVDKFFLTFLQEFKVILIIHSIVISQPNFIDYRLRNKYIFSKVGRIFINNQKILLAICIVDLKKFIASRLCLPLLNKTYII
jgi:hypothetical protein